MANGLFLRVISLVNKIKAVQGYSETDGLDLGIEGTSVSIDTSSLKPEVSIRIGNAGKAEIVWKKKNLDGIEIHKDSGYGFALYAMDAHPNYTDNAPVPDTPTLWKYKVIYLSKDGHIGQWSDVLSIHVGA